MVIVPLAGVRRVAHAGFVLCTQRYADELPMSSRRRVQRKTFWFGASFQERLVLNCEELLPAGAGFCGNTLQGRFHPQVQYFAVKPCVLFRRAKYKTL